MLHYGKLGVSYKMVTLPLVLCVITLSLMGCGSSSRQEKERRSLAQLQRTKQKINTLSQFHRWLFTEHTAYAVANSPDRDSTQSALNSY